MMSFLVRGRSKQTAIAAGASLVGIMVNHYALSREEQSQRKEEEEAHQQKLSSVMALSNHAQCDGGGAFLTSNIKISARRLQRHSTLKLLEEYAISDSRLESRYAVQWQKPLGEGTFGAVYLALDRETGQEVAVKQIHKRYTDSAAFQREMDALLFLKENGGHPNICSMREHYDEGGAFYLVLDLVNGREMFEQLGHAGPYSEADAARLVQEAASALAFLHGIGMIHTDLKPENLMLSSKDSKDAVIKLVDLGCAHFVGVHPDHEQRPKGTANTPAYCPPEVLLETRRQQQQQQQEDGSEPHQHHVNIAPSFDMWSLGIVIYIMLVGVHPFDLYGRASDEEIEDRIIGGDKPPLRGFKHAKHLSEDAMALIEGLMESDPEKRMTAQQVLDNRWVRGETATSKKIANSDKRLNAYRKYKTQIGAAFFKTLLSQTDAIHQTHTQERIPILEKAFRRLDTRHSGYLSTNEFQGSGGEDTKMSFSDVSSLLAENMTNQYFGKDHVVYKEGDEGDSMYFINSGTVEVTTEDGFQKTRQSGELFGQDVLMNDNVHSSTVICKTPVHVLEISRELFEKYVSSDMETFLSMAETERHARRERASTILRLNKNGRIQNYKKGDKIFSEGQKGNKLYLLQDGDIDISVQGHKVRSLRQGEMSGEHAAYYLGKPYNVTAQCVSDSCKVQALPSKVMHKLFRADPSLRRDFRELMLRRDFKKAVCTEIKRTFPTTQEEIRQAFEIIDPQDSGEIEYDKIRDMVWRFDPTYNEEDIRDMFESLNLNKNERGLTWEEFNRIFAMDKEA